MPTILLPSLIYDCLVDAHYTKLLQPAHNQMNCSFWEFNHVTEECLLRLGPARPSPNTDEDVTSGPRNCEDGCWFCLLGLGRRDSILVLIGLVAAVLLPGLAVAAWLLAKRL